MESALRGVRFSIVAVAIGAASSGCMLSPTNGRSHPSKASALTVSGYYPAPNATVSVSSSAKRAGPFSVLTTTQTAATGVTFSSGGTWYGFGTSAVIPSWTLICGGYEAFVKTQVGSITLAAFDTINQDGQTPLQCLNESVAGGSSSLSAIAQCSSPDGPAARVTVPAGVPQPATFSGDIVIDDLADSVQWACLQTLTGNLTVNGGTLEDIHLPSLESVSGNVTLSYPWAAREFDTRKLTAPNLTAVGGDLVLSGSGPGTPSTSVNFGLPALASVGGDLSVNFSSAFGVNLSGLASLSSLGGDLSVVAGGGDTSGAFLPALTSLPGDAFFDLGHNLFGGFMNALVSVGGDFELVDGNPNTNGFQNLTSVGGDMLLSDTTYFAPQYGFPKLAAVGGQLSILALQKDDLHIGDPTGLAVGSLLVHDSPGLDVLDAAHLSVAGSGTIDFQNNVNLCTSSITAWRDALAGWSGVSVVSGNGPC